MIETPTIERLDIGGRRLALTTQGTGEPTVVFEGGRGLDSRLWRRVLPEVATFTRACAYDRAGLGTSDPAASPRWFDALVDDLEALLRAGRVRAPYVLVAHSTGGYIARLFAARHPGAVAGLVFLDPWSEEQLPRLKRLLPADAYAAMVARIPGAIPAEVFGTGRPADDERDLVEIRAAAPPPGIPVVVVSSGQVDDRPPGGLTVDQWEPLRRELQAAFAATFPGSEHWIAEESGHLIPRDQPVIVAQAVRRVVELARFRQAHAFEDTANHVAGMSST